MACSACGKRGNGGGRIIPVSPNKTKVVERKGDRGAIAQGNTLRQNLRFTGR